MRMTTLLWGLFVAAIGLIAILRGVGMEISVVGVTITLLIAFGIALGIAAFVPQKPRTEGLEGGFENESADGGLSIS